MAHTLSLAAALAGAVVLIGLSATPAAALTGREAVSDCVQRGESQCAWTTQRDGAIRVNLSDGTALQCASADGACAMRYQPRATLVAEAPPRRYALRTRR